MDLSEEIKVAAQTTSPLGVLYHQIKKPYQKNCFAKFYSKCSKNMIRGSINQYIHREKVIAEAQRRIFQEKNIKMIRHNLRRYKKNDFSVAEFISQNGDKKEDNLDTKDKKKKVILQRKYNSSLSIKVSSIYQAQQLEQYKNRMRQAKSLHSLSHQPLLKQANKKIKKCWENLTLREKSKEKEERDSLLKTKIGLYLVKKPGCKTLHRRNYTKYDSNFLRY